LTETSSLGARLKKALLEAGLKQRQLATAAGIGESYLTHILKDERVPSPRVLRDLAATTGVTVQWLTDGSGPMRLTPAAMKADDDVAPLQPPPVAHLLEFLHADAALDPFTGLPGGPGAREQFREELAEAERKLAVYAEDLMRALEHRKQELLAEARSPKR
jgi:transcriptional regulator with XRE-family HTH domain